jgi:hypothetical protein
MSQEYVPKKLHGLIIKYGKKVEEGDGAFLSTCKVRSENSFLGRKQYLFALSNLLNMTVFCS